MIIYNQRREFILQRAITTVWKIQYPLNIIDKESLQSNKEIVASEFLSKYYRPLWEFRHTEVDACQEGNEFGYLHASKLFERIWKNSSAWGRLRFEITVYSVPPFHSRQQLLSVSLKLRFESSSCWLLNSLIAAESSRRCVLGRIKSCRFSRNQYLSFIET